MSDNIELDEEQLDEEQREAVHATDRAIAVLAGPGSGKTRVLSHRARYLLRKDAKSKALLLTFTNKAAAEMKSRALRTAAVPSYRINACTFHSFSLGILRSHGKLIGIDPDFETLDGEEQRHMATQAAAAAGLKNRSSDWSRYRCMRKTPPPDVSAFGKVYQKAKQVEGVVDFDDLVVYTADLFEKRVDIAEAYSGRYPHVLIDEFQDTNAVQFAIVRALVSHVKTVGVFADDDQAIFHFAGADAENIFRFIDDLDATKYSLTINYRCREHVVKHANLLIAADAACSGRQMKAYESGGTIESRVFGNVQEEGIAVAEEIAKTLAGGGRAEDISVLVRSSYRAEAMLRQLAVRNTPVSNWLDPSHESTERRLLRGCLGVTRDTLSGSLCGRLSKFFKIPKGTVSDTAAFLRPHINVPGIKELLEVRELAKSDAGLGDVLKKVHAAVDAVDSELAYNLNTVLNEVEAFQKHDPEFTLEHLLAELSLGHAGGAPTEGGGVKVASLHRTKGLQWPQVYLVGMEDDTLPHYRSKDDPAEVRHERRLCFVGVCRAESHLTFTRVEELNGYPKKPSRFLEEMQLR